MKVNIKKKFTVELAKRLSGGEEHLMLLLEDPGSVPSTYGVAHNIV